MQALARFTCISGSAKVYTDRLGKGQPLAEGESVELPVADFPAVSEDDAFDSLKDAVMHSKTAPGIGGNSGKVQVTAVNAPLLVTQYLDTNKFLDADKDDKRRHKLKIGNSVTADLTGSNVLTLIVEDVL